MARGYPDYNNPLYNIASRNLDLSSALLAQRGILSVDGLGRMVYATNWSEGFEDWETTQSGAGTLYKPVGITPEIAPVCMACTTGALSGNTVDLTRNFSLTDYSGVGVQTSFLQQFNQADFLLRLEMWHYTSATSFQRIYQIRFYPSNGDITFLNNEIGETLIGSFTGYGSLYRWVPVKLVVDPYTQAAARVLLGNVAIPIDIPMSIAPLDLPIIVRPILRARTRDNSARSQSVGHMLLTYDEPV